MNVKSFLETLNGQWQGTYKLWLDPTHAPEQSDTSMVVKATANGSYYLIHYDWLFKNSNKAGIFLLASKDDKVQVTWGDSFHMDPMPMVCAGELKQSTLGFTGSYPAGEETWYWRTEFTLENDKLIMRAFNIMPSGQEDIALEATYRRND